ncbi:hypothetical protein DIZ81_11030 [Legionella taurinensis]|uniref:Uncharacterized protein n=1 Tax=Legionella taurinensis TaxID=70611 RepID=A0AB38N4B4_9GAMM|nr:hypothetical protein [Legionella taurinensis]MDX1838384.1 hypothetical protein [Legionella taurinensis]PUT39144.1 hypothetical protein DB744_11040 [Legionella taurinensis]PUT39769.1 hypothetical protein DB746_13215 [Legionella taurinensis]PUT43600.1 hypothetical protein DB743_10430 [Legionella taurinensis]PUT45256.1 hypothetical protein DB745_13155 [Legionella taurinensis]
MQNKVESSVNHDLVCPLTGRPFRHPVLASDGHHYELKALNERLKAGHRTGFHDREAIFFASYDLPLRNDLDNMDLPERYDEYERQPYLEQLTERLGAPYKPWKQDAYKAFLTADALLLVVVALNLFKECKTLDADSLLVLMLTTTLLDYGIRFASNHQYGLAEGLRKVPRFLHWVGEVISVDPDEHESILRL